MKVPVSIFEAAETGVAWFANSEMYIDREESKLKALMQDHEMECWR